ncbi:MAG: hypothetical protein AAGF12_32765 [Myxococcota bacterium]
MSTVAFGLVVGFMGGLPSRALGNEVEGQRLLEEGLAARSAGRLVDAEELIRRSLEVFEWSYSAWQLGDLLTEMGRPTEALEVLRDILSGRYGGEVEGEAETDVRASVRLAEAQLARVELRVGEPHTGAVRVDGRRVAELRDQRRIEIETDPGQRLVQVDGADFEAMEEQLRLRPGDNSPAVLERAPAEAMVFLRSDEDVNIEVVGVESGVGELRLRLPPEVYTILTAVDDAQNEQELTVEAGETYRLDLDRPGSGGPPVWLFVGLGVLAAAGVAVLLTVLLQDSSEDLPVDLFPT